MIYAVIILSIALWGMWWWAIGLKVNLRHEKIDNTRLKEEICKLQKENAELQRNIYELVEGGMIQQEAVQMRWEAEYKKQRDMQEIALRAHKLAAQQSGLSRLAGLGGYLNPIRNY